MKRKLTIGDGVRVNAYRVISDAVESAIILGLRHAYKHAEHSLSDEEIARVSEYVERDVLNALCEVLVFPDDA